MRSIDLNSDVGEGFENEDQLMPFLSSCNIACGAHAGDKNTMKETIAFAKKYAVKVGAHPSYPDRANFGRLEMNISSVDLKASLKAQISLLLELAKEQGVHMHHVKPHGALYNKAAIDEQTAHLIVEAVLEIDDSLTLYVPYGSIIATVAKTHLPTALEGFADRAYNDDYSLVTRNKRGSVFTTSEKVIEHVLPMIQKKTLTTIHKKEIVFAIDTLCVHGDTENAMQIVKDLHQRLVSLGIKIGL